MNDTQGTFRTLLKNEITWMVMIVIGVMGFVKTVVIPLSNVQITITQIQQSLANSANDYKALDGRVTQNSNDIIKIQTQISK